jgi:hypothetical protein
MAQVALSLLLLVARDCWCEPSHILQPFHWGLIAMRSYSSPLTRVVDRLQPGHA